MRGKFMYAIKALLYISNEIIRDMFVMYNNFFKINDDQMTSAQNKRYHEIDNLYIIGILLVILGHSHSSNWTAFSGTVLEKTIEFIYTFHMPLFFFIAGFLFINSSRLENVGYGVWIKQKALKLLIPYVVLSLIAMLPKGLLTGHFDNVLYVLLQPRLGVWGHFWFIPVVFLLYVIFGLLKKLMGTQKNVLVLSLMFVFACIIYLKSACVFFVGGMLFYVLFTRKEMLSSHLTYVIECLVLFLVSIILFMWHNHSIIIRMVIAFLMILGLWSLAALIHENRFAKWVSAHNFIFYIYSWPFQAIVMVMCEHMHLTWFFMMLCMFFAGIIGPLLLILVYEKFRWIQCKFFDLMLGLSKK